MRLILLATALVSAGIVSAQQPQMRLRPMPPPSLPGDTDAQRTQLIEQLAAAIEENYVFPDIARRYAQALRVKAAAGGYANLGDRFGETVTADLQAINPDRHLRFGPTPPEGEGGPGPRRMMRRPVPADAGGPRPASAQAAPPEVRVPAPSAATDQAGWIADGVAYISFSAFLGDPEGMERIRRFLNEHQNARVVIFDLRVHRGGGLAELDLIASWIYGRETVLLGGDTRLAVEQRRGIAAADESTLRRVPGPKGVVRRMHYAVPSARATPLREARIFVLTSRRTVSAAEHFALALKRTGRATVIGETTAGLGNYGAPVAIGAGYTAFIPFGRSFDPDNDQGWDGTGVSPNVAVPADQALDEALQRLGISPEQRRPLAASR